ncbi:MAG: hypothetical protein CHACPFDD_03799 [Phycisphaerae bacterium]|nr:hypothetical protein [Phycisphaerae bacterium]
MRTWAVLVIAALLVGQNGCKRDEPPAARGSEATGAAPAASAEQQDSLDFVQGELLNAVPQSAPASAGAAGGAAPRGAGGAVVTPAAMAFSAEPEVAAGKTAYSPISFQRLSDYDYEMPDPAKVEKVNTSTTPIVDVNGQIPDAIKGLHGKKIVLQGFMIPTVVDKEGVKAFILCPNQMMCCFGVTPWMNEWVSVRSAEGKPIKYVGDVLVQVYGTLEVGEEIKEGWVVSLYRMVSDDVVFKSGF